jgi:hypothetical protein
MSSVDQSSRNSGAHHAEPRGEGETLFVARFGIGKWCLGKADLVFDVNTGLEQFRTTVFILVFYFPLIPTGSYLIRKRRGFFSRKITVLRKLPLDWMQVLRVWAVAGAALYALLWVLKHI